MCSRYSGEPGKWTAPHRAIAIEPQLISCKALQRHPLSLLPTILCFIRAQSKTAAAKAETSSRGENATNTLLVGYTQRWSHPSKAIQQRQRSGAKKHDSPQTSPSAEAHFWPFILREVADTRRVGQLHTVAAFLLTLAAALKNVI